MRKNKPFRHIEFGYIQPYGRRLPSFKGINPFSEGTIFITFSLQINKEGGVANGIFGNAFPDSGSLRGLHRIRKEINNNKK